MSDTDTEAADTSVFEEVVEAIKASNAKFKHQAVDEPDGKFLTRLLEGLSEAPDETYNGLSEASQAWFKEAAELANVNKAAPYPPGFKSAFKEPGKPAGKPIVSKGKGKTNKAEKVETKAESTEPKRGRAKHEGPTIGETVRRAVIENRDIKLAELETKLAELGFENVKKSTIFSFQRGAIDTLKVAEAMGRFSWN